jgi:hypothetical protein
MYFFLIFGLPLAFVFLLLREYPINERGAAGKAFCRGLVASIPITLVARLLGAIVPASYGSILLAFHEWADRLLPYAVLPALCYLAFYRPGERLSPGAAPRRLTAFYAGSLAPIGLFETYRVWGNPEPYALFLLPIFLASICLAMPKVAAFAHGGYGISLLTTVGAALLATLVASLCPYLFLVRLWPIALLAAAAAALGAWRFAYSDLEARPALPIA